MNNLFIMKFCLLVFALSSAVIALADDADKKAAITTEAAKSPSPGSSEQKETLPFGLNSSMSMDEIKSKLKAKKFLKYNLIKDRNHINGKPLKHLLYKSDGLSLNGTSINEVYILIYDNKITGVELWTPVVNKPELGKQNLVNLAEFFTDNDYSIITNNFNDIKIGSDLGYKEAVFILRASDNDGVCVAINTYLGKTAPFASVQLVNYIVLASSAEMQEQANIEKKRKNYETLDKLK